MRKRNTVLAAAERFRALDPGVTLTQFAAFLYVCENEGLSVSELAVALGGTRATASRVARSLGAPEESEGAASRLGLVTAKPDRDDLRGKSLILTRAGRALRAEVDDLIRQARPIA